MDWALVCNNHINSNFYCKTLNISKLKIVEISNMFYYLKKKSQKTCFCCNHNTWMVSFIIMWQLGKIPVEEIEKDLTSIGVPNEAVKGIVDVLSIKSLSDLEGSRYGKFSTSNFMKLLKLHLDRHIGFWRRSCCGSEEAVFACWKLWIFTVDSIWCFCCPRAGILHRHSLWGLFPKKKQFNLFIIKSNLIRGLI